MIAWKERMKDGRHVGLDFYDLLIEPIWNDIARPRAPTGPPNLHCYELATSRRCRPERSLRQLS